MCLSVCGLRICCQFVVVISLERLATPTDGDALGCLPLKGVINRTLESSALTPCRGRLPGPRSRGQRLPFTPRCSRSLPWPFLTRRRANRHPLFRSGPAPGNPHPFASFPLPSTQTRRRRRHSLVGWVLSSLAPSLSSTLVVSAVYVQVMFCFESLRRKLMCPWAECLCL